VLFEDSEIRNIMHAHWGLPDAVVVSRRQTRPMRTVARVATDGGDLGVKIDYLPHDSVAGGAAVQALIAAVNR
jgi:hypothetical protein